MASNGFFKLVRRMVHSGGAVTNPKRITYADVMKMVDDGLPPVEVAYNLFEVVFDEAAANPGLPLITLEKEQTKAIDRVYKYVVPPPPFLMQRNPRKKRDEKFKEKKIAEKLAELKEQYRKSP